MNVYRIKGNQSIRLINGGLHCIKCDSWSITGRIFQSHLENQSIVENASIMIIIIMPNKVYWIWKEKENSKYLLCFIVCLNSLIQSINVHPFDKSLLKILKIHPLFGVGFFLKWACVAVRRLIKWNVMIAKCIAKHPSRRKTNNFNITTSSNLNCVMMIKSSRTNGVRYAWRINWTFLSLNIGGDWIYFWASCPRQYACRCICIETNTIL